jgi:hypothetical protein
MTELYPWLKIIFFGLLLFGTSVPVLAAITFIWPYAISLQQDVEAVVLVSWFVILVGLVGVIWKTITSDLP